MKINDTELLQAIWTHQLKTLSTDVIHSYTGGMYNVCGESWFKTASAMRMSQSCNYGGITNVIGKQQLSARVKRLIP